MVYFMRKAVSIAIGIIAGFSFGTAPIFIRLLLNVDSNSIAFARLFIGFWALLLLIYLRNELKQFIRVLMNYNWKHILMGSLLGLQFIFFVASVKHTTILHATIFVNTAPIQALILSLILFRTKPSRREILSVLLGFTGILTITLTEKGVSAGNIIGDLEALLAATFEAFYLNLGADLRKRVNAKILMVSNFMIGFIVVYLYCIPAQGGIHIPLDYYTILILLALGLLPTAIGHTLYIASVKALKPYETAMMALLEPISASILAVILFNEIPGVNSIIGSILIALAILLLF